MLDGRALAVPLATLAAAPAEAALAPPGSPPGASNRAVWILPLLGVALLLILVSVFSPVLASASRLFDGVSERRLELAGIGLVVLTALLVTGGAGL